MRRRFSSVSAMAALACAAIVATAGANSPAPPFPAAVVSLASVSNGCGGGPPSDKTRFGDTSTYLNSNNPLGTRYHVDFRQACNLHDAGYTGAEVKDPINGGYVDYFDWGRLKVDENFLENMRAICEHAIPASASVALADCKATGGKTSFGAETRYNLVRRFGAQFYRVRPSVEGSWTPQPAGGSPDWVFTQDGRVVTARWRGGAGHSGLRGTFNGVIVSHDEGDVIKGTMVVNEATLHVTGTMTFQIDQPDKTDGNINKLTMTYRQANGVGGTGTFER